MLKGISPLVSPDLLAVMARMGHGDELVLADAHFPGESTGKRVIRADGLRIASLLEAIMPLFELDSYVPHPVIMMEPVPGDYLDPVVEASFMEKIRLTTPGAPPVKRLDRFAFYKIDFDFFPFVRRVFQGVGQHEQTVIIGCDGRIFQFQAFMADVP